MQSGERVQYDQKSAGGGYAEFDAQQEQLNWKWLAVQSEMVR